MDMTDDSERLLQQFFSEAARQQIADDGFTERVMQQLPVRKPAVSRNFLRLWTLACVAVYVVLFVVLDGWQLLLTHVEVLVRTALTGSITFNPMMAVAVVFGLLFVGVGETLTSERRLL